MTDLEHLARALELAERGRGGTAPNPVVGAVLVRDGAVVGEGWHERAGGPHAEIVALEAAGDDARGATLYVSLEPCAHHGRTPPCADALAAAGVTRVVAAVGDPNPKTNGAGFEQLRAAGIEVELAGGDLEWRARVQNEALSRLGGRAAAVRRLQGGRDPGRARDGSGLSVGDRRGEPPPRPRAARRDGRGRRRHGHGARGRPAADRARRRRRAPAAAPRLRPRAAPGRLRSSSS